MFSAVLKRAGIKGAYVPFMVRPDEIGRAVESLRVLNMAGANVTVPYKERIMPHLDTLSEGATIIGAVNTIVRNGSVLKGYNTNAIGFMDALDEADFDVPGKSALVFGTGGAAKAVVFILNWLRAESVLITGRNEERIEGIASQIGGVAKPLASVTGEPLRVNIVVNATSVSSPDESPRLAELAAQLDMPECELVLDLNYGRTENFWQSMAQTKGIRFMDGLSPLAYQARRTFALWTGVHVEPQEFRRAIDQI
jgi:shikimate dehydrogenase